MRKPTSLSDFFRNFSEEEKKEIYLDVAQKATELQLEILEKAKVKSWEQQIFEYACWLCERDGHNPYQEFVEYDRSSYDYDEHIYYRWQDYELEAQRAVEYFGGKI